MSKGLKALKVLYETMPFVFESSRTKMNCYETIEKELRDQRKKLTIIGEILVDISKGNYSDLKDAIKEIREVL